MIMIEINENKVDDLKECIEKGLRYLGKAMQLLEDFDNRGQMGNRYDYQGQRGGGYSYNRYGDEDYYMGERRRR